MPRKKKEVSGPAPAVVAAPMPPLRPPPADPRSGLSPPAEPRGRYTPRLYPGSNERVDAVLLADWAFGWATHWSPGDGTQPHEVPDESCPYCKRGQLPRFAWYVPCITVGTHRHRIMQISHDAWLGCPDLTARQGHLRGLTVSLHRKGMKTNGRVTAAVLGTRAPAGLPNGYDVRPALSRLWGRVETWLEEQCGPYRDGATPPGGRKEGGAT